jgi:hypothetical protein
MSDLESESTNSSNESEDNISGGDDDQSESIFNFRGEFSPYQDEPLTNDDQLQALVEDVDGLTEATLRQ